MKTRWIGLVALALTIAAIATLVVGVSAQATPSSPSASAAPAATAAPQLAAAAVTINLCASAGTIALPGSVSAPIWGFSIEDGAAGCADDPAQLPGPVLTVNQGDVVTVNLTESVPGDVALEFPGQVTSAPPGTPSASYTFTASSPGTFIYDAMDARQALMGLYGALIVRPTGHADWAYGFDATAFGHEQTLVLSEIDPAFNANPSGFDLVDYAPTFWLINGEAYPNTDDIAAPDDVSDDAPLLLRLVNAGSTNHAMAMLGARYRIIAKDADPLIPFSVVSETIASGQTMDVVPCDSAGAATLYNGNLHLVNGATSNASHNPGGMLVPLDLGTIATPCPAAGPPAPVDTPPTVSAGDDQTITLPAAANLDGTVTDDGLSALMTLWTKASGPGTVTFGDASAVDTTASFSAAGTYVLRLTATDSTGPVFDEVQITVNAASGSTMHVGDLDNESNNPRNPNWNVRVRVTVHTSTHTAVVGAVVSATLTYNSSSVNVTCTTGNDGRCRLQAQLSDSIASATLSVTNVTASGLTYAAGSNHDPDTDSNGTTITVSRP